MITLLLLQWVRQVFPDPLWVYSVVLLAQTPIESPQFYTDTLWAYRLRNARAVTWLHTLFDLVYGTSGSASTPPVLQVRRDPYLLTSLRSFSSPG